MGSSPREGKPRDAYPTSSLEGSSYTAHLEEWGPTPCTGTPTGEHCGVSASGDISPAGVWLFVWAFQSERKFGILACQRSTTNLNRFMLHCQMANKTSEIWRRSETSAPPVERPRNTHRIYLGRVFYLSHQSILNTCDQVVLLHSPSNPYGSNTSNMRYRGNIG